MGMSQWPELVMALGHSMASSDAATLDGALNALYKIVEEHPQQVGNATAHCVSICI